MWKNYLKTALRNLKQRPGYTMINVAGLAVGIACCVLIFLFVRDELSYDRFHTHADRIYRVALERLYPNRSTEYAMVPPALGPTLRDNYAAVEEATRVLAPFGEITITYQEASEEPRRFQEARFYFADSAFFEAFTFPLLHGDPETALDEPNSVVITTETAQRYFGEADPIGKRLEGPFEQSYTVTGVTAPVPANAHFHYDFVASLASHPLIDLDNWIGFATHTYLVLEPGASPETLEAQFPDLVRRYAGPQIQERLGTSFEDYEAAGNGYRYFLQPLTDIHLHSQLESELEPNGNITYVYLFGAIAVFILLIACINFMNLATARSASRAKEVGVRKVVGARRTQLVRQFLAESTLLSSLALLLGIGLVELVLPAFNAFTGKQLALNLLDGVTLPGLLLFALGVGLLAGSYPALLLSGFQPVTVLKGRFQTSRQNAFARNGLVVFQFAVSIVLLVGTAVVYSQLRYLLDKDLGFEEEQVVVVQNAWPLQEQHKTFKEALLERPSVVNATAMSTIPGGYFPGVMLQPVGSQEVLTGRLMNVDHDFFETMGIAMEEGRAFSRAFSTDTLAVILNEAAVRELGLSEPVGERLSIPAADEVVTVVGVVDDFHFQSLHQRISPLALQLTPPQFPPGFVAVRVRPENLSETLAFLETTWGQFVPEQPLTYSFLDEDFEALYAAEQQTGQLASLFSALAILIACLGLFGLAAYTAEQRTKEIGVRKVLGASAASIVALLSRDFVKLVLIAFALAAPVAYLAMQQWLEGFAYRIAISPWVFLGAGATTLLIALLTVSYQAVKAALADPVKSLRHE